MLPDPLQPMAMSSEVVVPPRRHGGTNTKVPPCARTMLLSFTGFLHPSEVSCRSAAIACLRPYSTVTNVQRYGHGTLSEVFACNVCLPALTHRTLRLTMGGCRLHARRPAHTTHSRSKHVFIRSSCRCRPVPMTKRGKASGRCDHVATVIWPNVALTLSLFLGWSFTHHTVSPWERDRLVAGVTVPSLVTETG